MSEVEPLALSINDTIKTLSSSRGTVYALIAKGTLIAFKDGGRTKVDYQSVKRHYASLPKFIPGVPIPNNPKVERKGQRS
jgi:excisionase family DNA binding protein